MIDKNRPKKTVEPDSDRFIVSINTLNPQGDGVGFHGNQKIVLEKILPGEQVEVRYIPNRPRKERLQFLRVIKYSPQRVSPPCPYFEQCGGCQLQHLAYPAQLEWKNQQIRHSIRQFPELDSTPISEVVPMPGEFYYRNKTQMPLRKQGDTVVYGLYRSGTHEIIPIDHCLVENRDANLVLQTVRDWAQHFGIEPYDELRGSGVLRYVLIRKGQFSHQVMVVVVCRRESLPYSADLIRRLQDKIPALKSVILNINDQVTNVILGKRNLVLWGDPFIEEILGQLRFRIYSNTFFQNNSVQMLRLVDRMISLLELQKTELVLDLFCGTGTIGLLLSHRVQSVLGIENNPDSVKSAQENARDNGVTNIRFRCMDLNRGLSDEIVAGYSPEIIILDPPRRGAGPELIKSVIKLSPVKIAYVSCNPDTLLPELGHLAAAGYQTQGIYPFDMFPHTAHVECLAILHRQPEPLSVNMHKKSDENKKNSLQ